MPRISITDITAQRLKTVGVYTDTSLPAFGLRVGKTAKSWFIIPDQRRVRQVIGHYPDMSVAKARDLARRLLATRSRHHVITFGEAVERFLELHTGTTRPTTSSATARHINGYYIPKFAARPLHDIKTHEIMDVIDKLRHYPGEQRHTFDKIRQFYRWASVRGYCDNILVGLRRPTPSVPRERVLLPEEIAKIWRACSQSGERWHGFKSHQNANSVAQLVEPSQGINVVRFHCEADGSALPRLPTNYCTIIKLLICTGQRRGEIAALQKSWIQPDRINLPKEIVKNKKPHSFPIGAFCAEILTQQTNTQSHANGCIFFERTAIFNDWSKAKIALDKKQRSHLIKRAALLITVFMTSGAVSPATWPRSVSASR